MSYFVYILYSIKCDRYYIGYSEDPEMRLEERHNKGYVKATRACYPYRLVKKKGFVTELEAIQEELRLKKQKSRKYIECLINGNW
jgi:putative endonuclease